jgi:hypothetical protein
MTNVRAVTIFRFFGAISSSFHRTQFMPNVEQRLDTIVAMVASSIPTPDKIKLSIIHVTGHLYAALHQKNCAPAERDSYAAPQPGSRVFNRAPTPASLDGATVLG